MSQPQRDKYCAIHLHELSRVVRLIEAESGAVLTGRQRGRGGEGRAAVVQRYSMKDPRDLLYNNADTVNTTGLYA